MGDIARCSHYNEAKLFKLFGVNAELLIDRTWGWEPTTIADIRAYKPSSNCSSVGQVLHCPNDYEQAKLIAKEMIDQHVLNLFTKGLVTNQIVLDIGYDIENLTDPKRSSQYHGEVTTDHYVRKVPKHAHSTTNLKKKTSSSRIIMDAVLELYDRIVDKNLLIRRITIAAVNMQLTLFDDPEELQRQEQEGETALAREKRVQNALVEIKTRFGKNAILKGMNLKEGATAKERNSQVGGHRA